MSKTTVSTAPRVVIDSRSEGDKYVEQAHGPGQGWALELDRFSVHLLNRTNAMIVSRDF